MDRAKYIPAGTDRATLCFRPSGNWAVGKTNRLYWRNTEQEVENLKNLNQNNNRIRVGLETTDIGQDVTTGGRSKPDKKKKKTK